jgi:hypothetical protein
MATTKKSNRSSRLVRKLSEAPKLPRSTRSTPQAPDANGTSASKTALTKSMKPQLERAMDQKNAGTSIDASLAERDGISSLARSYAGMLAFVSYSVAAAKIADPKALQATLGLEEKEFLAATHDSFAEFAWRMKPRDPLEKLTLEQLMLHHARVLRLSIQACEQSDPERIKLLHEACDGASGAYRRLMTAFNENRRPPRQPAAIAIDQANVANQQIVQNVTPHPGKKRQTNKDSKE